MRIVHVLWAGGIGGAERLNVSLAAEFRRRGVDARVLLIGDAGPMGAQLDLEQVPYEALGFPRGSAVLRCPRRFARLATELGADAAILVYVGYLGVALRAGGYRGKILGVEHGALNVRQRPARAMLRLLDRAVASFIYDAEVAVSRFQASQIRRTVHARRLVLIPHGVRIPSSAALARPAQDGLLRIGHLSRLVSGKGADVAIRALAELRQDRPDVAVTLEIAGDGPERASLEALTVGARLSDRVRFVGMVGDVDSFWADKDLAVALGDHVESFGMSALEAMACGKALVASSLGALPELIREGTTGFTANPHDPDDVLRVLRFYLDDPSLSAVHGEAALQLVAEQFSLERCAGRYLELVARL